ncbi:MAG: hypothetical protein AB7W28_00470 [Armatimonadota bacterium]
MRLVMLFVGAVVVLLMAGCGGSEEGPQPFKVGVASVKITPEKEGLYLGGWGENRRYTKIHDDIYARAIVFERGDTKVAWVALDLVGLMEPDVEDIRARVKDLPPANIVIACSHVHSAPDTIGLWGPDEATCGVDPEYLEFVKARTADAIKQALQATHVARVRLAQAKAPARCAINHQDAATIDSTISILQAVNPADEPVATVVNWACHPECLDKHNLEITSDYVHWLRQVVEADTGAPCIFFNGALGGMVSPDIEEHTFAEAERVGTTVGQVVVEALKEAEGPLRPDLAFRSEKVTVPVANETLRQAAKVGLIAAYRGQAMKEVQADIAVMWLGPSVWMTMPGEPLPAVGLEAKDLVTADYEFLVSLANSELGYILPKAFWEREQYKYEMSMSIGPDTADLCLSVLRSLLNGAPEWATAKKSAGTAASKEKPGTEKKPVAEAEAPAVSAPENPVTSVGAVPAGKQAAPLPQPEPTTPATPGANTEPVSGE